MDADDLGLSGETLLDESADLGDIKINLSVVASIVRLAALNIEGVTGVGGSFVDGITEIFSKKESERGVRVTEDPSGAYLIEIRVILQFGSELAKVAYNIQQAVQEQVFKMTNKEVAKVDVIIDGIKMQVQKESNETSSWDIEHTD